MSLERERERERERTLNDEKFKLIYQFQSHERMNMFARFVLILLDSRFSSTHPSDGKSPLPKTSKKWKKRKEKEKKSSIS